MATRSTSATPAAEPTVPLANGDGVEASTPVLGPSRIVWVFRPGNYVPMAVGKLYVVREDGSPHHLLQPRRRLAAGRYELMFARYGVRWPVTLASVADGDHADDMLVWGRVPL